jgi:hypothetical protein
MTDAELLLIARWVPVYGVRETARALSRDWSGVARHARRMGVRSPPPGPLERRRDANGRFAVENAEALYGALAARQTP